MSLAGTGSGKASKKPGDRDSKSGGNNGTGRKIKSSVVHETHAINSLNKLQHVSKVYFYSVADVLQGEGGKEGNNEQGVTLPGGSAASDKNNKNGGRLSHDQEREYAKLDSCNTQPGTPRISAPASELDFLDLMLENSPNLDSKLFHNSVRLKNSLRRCRENANGGSNPRSQTPTQSFPITNGSLYSDLSLSRKVADSQRAKRREERDSFNITATSLIGSSCNEMDSFDNPLDASQLNSSGECYSPTRSNISSSFLDTSSTSFSPSTSSSSSNSTFNSSISYSPSDSPRMFPPNSRQPMRMLEKSAMFSMTPKSVTLNNNSNSDIKINKNEGNGLKNQDLALNLDSVTEVQNIKEKSTRSVISWLGELRSVHECECTIMLQSKPVRRDSTGSHRTDGLTADSQESVTSLRNRIRGVQDRAHMISTIFSNLCREVSHENQSRKQSTASENGCKVLPYIHSLIHQINLFFLECESQDWRLGELRQFPGLKVGGKSNWRLKETQTKLLDICEEVKTGLIVDKHELVNKVTAIGSLFSKTVELILGLQVGRCVARLTSAMNKSEVEATLGVVTSLALEGNNLCRILVADGAVASILYLCRDQAASVQVRTAALRALGSICCVLEGIQEFCSQAGHLSVLGILVDRARGEGERREAAGVLAQVTSPWIHGNTGIPKIQHYIKDTVFALKDLLKKTNSLETFLLCSAALANLSSLHTDSLAALANTGVLSVLLSHPATASASVYIQDQLVTILANMAKDACARVEMLECQGIHHLVRILSNSCSGQSRDTALQAATERTVSKAAIALARLCQDPVSANTVVDLGGLERLHDLAQQPLPIETDKKSRNANIDTVQMAAAAAIKTISIYSTVSLSPIAAKNGGLNLQPQHLDFYPADTPLSSLESFV